MYRCADETRAVNPALLFAREARVDRVQLHIGVAHRLWLFLPDHHLQVSGLEAVVLKAMNNSGGA
jgi:hypothetical protein